jgi:hypothetical protein
MKTTESFGGFSTWGMRGMRSTGMMKYFCGANIVLGLVACLGLRDAFANHWGYGLFELAWVIMFFGIAAYGAFALRSQAWKVTHG